MLFLAALSIASLTAVGVNAARNIPDVVPRDWLQRRYDSILHLGDDGVLRRMEIGIPSISRRDDHERAAHYEVRDAIPLNSSEIRRWIDAVSPGYSTHTRRHFDEVYAGIDGRDVASDDLMNPHPDIRLESPGSIKEARDVLQNQRRDEAGEGTGSRLSRRSSPVCGTGHPPCIKPLLCARTDKDRFGLCLRVVDLGQAIGGGGSGGGNSPLPAAPPSSPVG